MKKPRSHSRRLQASGLVVMAALSLAQVTRAAAQYEPTIGQEGKDVVWVPTNQLVVDKMLDMANVTASDFLIDLGSGDGRTVISAAKRGARAMGIEYNPDMVALAKRNAAKEGVADKTSFAKADIFKSDFSKATVLTLFLLPDINLRLRPKILNMKPGVRVVSNTFDMEDWEPEQKFKVEQDCAQFCSALFWIVPAKAQGKWRMSQGEFDLKQQYQMLSGTMKAGNATTNISGGKMTGDQIVLSAGDTTYTGRVNGNTIVGKSKSAAGETEWRATRVN